MPANPTPPKRLERLPPGWAPVQRANSRALLLEERRLLDGVHQDVDDVVSDAVREVAKRQDNVDSDAAKAALLVYLLAAADKMRARLRRRLRGGRLEARKAAMKRAEAELARAAAALGLGLFAFTPRPPGTHADQAHADAVADSFVAAWKSAAVFAVTRALRRDENPAKALDATAEHLGGRVRRIAATEASQAYNDEHRRVLADAAELLEDDVGTDVGLIVRRWDAILDARTCPTCASHDGEVTLLGKPFASGDEPGFVHPLCRCMSTVVALPRF